MACSKPVACVRCNSPTSWIFLGTRPRSWLRNCTRGGILKWNEIDRDMDVNHDCGELSWNFCLHMTFSLHHSRDLLTLLVSSNYLFYSDIFCRHSCVQMNPNVMSSKVLGADGDRYDCASCNAPVRLQCVLRASAITIFFKGHRLHLGKSYFISE